MDVLREFGRSTFSSLKIRNYRIYFIGQGFSHIGNWMQTVAMGWLVLQLTGSGVHLGAMLALRFAPLLLGSLFAGILVDSTEKRRLLYVTQWIAGFLALLMSVLIFADVMQMWIVYIAALLFGAVDAVDRPLRQTFLHEMVGPAELRNAVTLSSTEANLARALGPVFAGTLIATAGIALCFFANALSFVAVIIMLTLLRADEFHREVGRMEKSNDLLAGLRYAASVPVIRNVLIVMAFIGTISYEFHVSLPLLAQQTFLGTAADYAALLSAMGAGSVAGGLFVASRREVTAFEFVLSAFLFGGAMCVTAIMPTLGLATVGMIFIGFFSINLTSVGNTIVQLESPSYIRGRIMALWTMALFGSTLIGAPLIGLIGEYAGARWGIAIGGIAAILGAGYGVRQLLKHDRLQTVPAEVALVNEEAAAQNAKL
ncbi:hypothetical protein A3H16_02505 [Candidatus Kaiserbacteria bacterium RIFCSPLOWO2_12_FULL_53_8]|uniref:Major facilitator superfamily (MFS) profile domain-containing protein n=1 Tax=Candidatus Kaiserbacteria bacterium RIFCSPLOWO2_12_FULL_53_8 TaxID=1798529 RepID=A0A1F6G1N9_9BACT|nr:MAG: hypothetical protein A3H16_02505 [Candidatus Kaiserbacteria bacterium RIFCSPLOWO2_12_FULL_53_8]